MRRPATDADEIGPAKVQRIGIENPQRLGDTGLYLFLLARQADELDHLVDHPALEHRDGPGTQLRNIQSQVLALLGELAIDERNDRAIDTVTSQGGNQGSRTTADSPLLITLD